MHLSGKITGATSNVIIEHWFIRPWIYISIIQLIQLNNPYIILEFVHIPPCILPFFKKNFVKKVLAISVLYLLIKKM